MKPAEIMEAARLLGRLERIGELRNALAATRDTPYGVARLAIGDTGPYRVASEIMTLNREEVSRVLDTLERDARGDLLKMGVQS